MTLLTLEQMRADVAEILGVEAEMVVDGENLVDIGLDSIRIMALAERWSTADARINFDDLAEYPEIVSWHQAVSGRHAAAHRRP